MKRQLFLLIGLLLFVAGCQQQSFEPIAPDETFVATVNIDEPSLQFFDAAGEELATWQFEQYYTGGLLIGQDKLLMYSNILTKAHVYQLSTGEQLAEIKVPAGITGGYYDEESEQFFLANGKTNDVIAYDAAGQELATMAVRNYPMSMVSANGKLYVVNYKDTLLSVIDIATHKVEQEWAIDDYSHGIAIDPQKQEIWLGGHGKGSQSNEYVEVYDIASGKQTKTFELPIMPVGIAIHDDTVAVISHGSNMLYTMEQDRVVHTLKIGANPFAVTFLHDQIVVAGYDDHVLYFVQNNKIMNQVETEAGPFQLLVRE